jgi:hypothetical protein
MKGATMLATLQRLGVVPSFSRPSVSNDNPYSEAGFATLKGSPAYPEQPFESLEHARTWVATFVLWYNETHRHSALKFVTPGQRHRGEDRAVLAQRDALYQAAKATSPARWSGPTRNWEPPASVLLNPGNCSMTYATTTLTLTESGDLALQGLDLFLRSGFAAHKGLDVLGFDSLLQVHGAKQRQAPRAFAGRRTHLPVEAAVGGVDHRYGIGNLFDTVVRQAIQGIVFAGVHEEVFLRPACEHDGRRQGPRRGAVVGTQDRSLVAALAALAQLPHPQPVAQASAALGQKQGCELATGQSHLAGGELLLRPRFSGVFVVSQAGHALRLHPLEKVRGIALAVKDQREAV